MDIELRVGSNLPDRCMVDWARDTITTQTSTFYYDHLYKLMFPPIDAENDKGEDMSSLELVMRRRLRSSLDRTFLEKLSSCILMVGRNPEEWWPYVVGSCFDADYGPLLRSFGKDGDVSMLGGAFSATNWGNAGSLDEALPMDCAAEQSPSPAKKSKRGQRRLACIDAEYLETDSEALASICKQLRVGARADGGSSGRQESSSAVLENLTEQLHQCRLDDEPALIVLYNFHLFAMECQTISTSLGRHDGRQWGGGGTKASRKQQLIYTLLDLIHKRSSTSS